MRTFCLLLPLLLALSGRGLPAQPGTLPGSAAPPPSPASREPPAGDQLQPDAAEGDLAHDPAAAPANGDLDRIAVAPSGLLDIRLRGADIFDALELLSEQTRTNIVTCSGVSGTVSMVLRQVTFEDALRAILAVSDLRYEFRDGIS